MTATTLPEAESLIRGAKTPEDLFGPLEGEAAEQLHTLNGIYRGLARVTHPDHHRDPATASLASDVFARLGGLYEAAQAAIGRGTYGKGALASPVTFTTKRGAYTVTDLITKGDIANVYRCTDADGTERVLKLVRDPMDNDLMISAGLHLADLGKKISEQDKETYRRYAPTLVESFLTAEADGRRRQAHVFESAEPGSVTLEEVRHVYPNGVDPRDMAWIWRRLLTAVGTFAQLGNVSHGAVLPPHVLIHPLEHSLVVVGWGHSVVLGERITAVPGAWRPWYPAEVRDHENVDATLDLYLGAACMIYLLGGTIYEDGWRLPDTVPTQFRAYFRGVATKARSSRPQDAWALIGEFDELIERLWGRRRYRPLQLPK